MSKKMLYENLSIAVENEGDVYRAYAFNTVTGQNVATCKCTRLEGAVACIFGELRDDASDMVKRYGEFITPAKLINCLEEEMR